MFTVARVCAEFLRIVLFITRPISDYVLTFIYELFMGKTKPLPSIDDKILLLSATELANRIRKRQLRSEQVVQAYIDRSRAVNPLINAVVDERYHHALNDAKAVDDFLDNNQQSLEEIAEKTPLLGVPFTCKEAIGVKGLSQTCGITRAKGRVADADSDAAALYRKAGAIPLTVTNVPELCMWWESHNLIYGRTKNPYDHTRTVGGSTGGEGAIITAAGALIGIGNDIAGSIRLPASFNGIYGHKPSTGIISNLGFFPSDDQENEALNAYVGTGPMCRYVEDLTPLTRIMLKEEKKMLLNDKVDFRKVKVYYMEEFPGYLASSIPAVKKSIRKAAKYFREEYGIEPIPLKIDELIDCMSIWECKLIEAGMPSYQAILEISEGRLSIWLELLKIIIGQSVHTLPLVYNGIICTYKKDEFYEECLRTYKILESKFQQIFHEDAIFLLPTHPEPAPHLYMTIPKYANSGYTSIFSILGLPATTIPAGMCMGMPIGIQAISGRNQDRLTLAAAVELDKVFGGWKSPCLINV